MTVHHNLVFDDTKMVSINATVAQLKLTDTRLNNLDHLPKIIVYNTVE